MLVTQIWPPPPHREQCHIHLPCQIRHFGEQPRVPGEIDFVRPTEDVSQAVGGQSVRRPHPRVCGVDGRHLHRSEMGRVARTQLVHFGETEAARHSPGPLRDQDGRASLQHAQGERIEVVQMHMRDHNEVQMGPEACARCLTPPAQGANPTT